jgi:outer membrane protein OmpA-like peptidoglycan-associated protein
MRLRVVWLALIAWAFALQPVKADDFDDDFAAPKPKPAPVAPSEPHPEQAAEPVPAEAGAPSSEVSPPARPKAKPPKPRAKPKGSFAAFDEDFEAGTEVEASEQGQAERPEEAEGRVVRESPPRPMPVDDPGAYRDDSVPQPHSTIYGLVGGLHVVDGSSGPRRTFRASLMGGFFKKNGFIVENDHTRRMRTVVALSATPIEHLELSVAVSGYATENDTTSPRLVQSLGDTTFGAKGYFAPLPWLNVGGDMSLILLNGTGGVGFQTNATSVGLRAAATADLRNSALKKPIIVRTNLGYLFDNSGRLVESVEADRYASLNDPAPAQDEYRHLVTAAERYQLQVNRVDSLLLAFGAEFPIQIAKNFDVRPLVEWTIALPMNRQGYDCLVSNAAADPDSCLAREGFSARASDLTLGVRSEPGVRGLGVTLAVDIATSGASTAVRELAPNSRYELIGVISYAYDTRPARPMLVEREIEITPEEPVHGHLRGLVVDHEGAQPVAHAIVHIVGAPRSDLATDADGKFESYDLDPGTYTLEVSAPDYKENTCTAELPQGAEVGPSVRCELEPLPRQGGVRGTVTTPEGQPVPNASVELRGKETRTVHTDATGTFEATDLPSGSYEALALAPEYLMKATPFEVVPRQQASVALVLVPVPKQRLTELQTKNISIKKQVQFVQDSAEISEKSTALLAEIADLLIRNPQVTKVEVQGHTDYTGSAEYNQQLSQARAEAVRNWLIAAGVQADRLTAVGYGLSRPLVPNITEANRAKNRRVAFVILERE